MANTYNCDSCGKQVVAVPGAKRCEVCTPKFCGVIHATWYPTFFDERAKTNGQTS